MIITEVFLLIPKGIYWKRPLGVFTSEELAEKARRRARESSDGYHHLYIVKLELDTWALDQFRVLDGEYDGNQNVKPPPSSPREGLE